MARPTSNTLDYISLDTMDKTTLKRLTRKFGIEGRLFWYELLRLIARTEEYILDFSNKDTAEDYFEDELYVSSEVGFKILDQLSSWGNIDKRTWNEHKKVWCQNLIDRHELVFKKRNKIPHNPTCNDIPVTETHVSATETLVSVTESTQSKVKESKGNNILFYKSENDFLKDWKKARETILKKPTNIRKLNNGERINFNQIKSDYEIKYFRVAMVGMFEQKELYELNKLRPTHFLRDLNIEKYYDCSSNKIQLFGNKDQKGRL